MGNLYIFGLKLNLLDLPYNLGDIHRITINREGDIYFLSPKGLIKGFNYIKKSCYTPVPVSLQGLLEGVKWKPAESKEDEREEEYQTIIDDFHV